MPQETNLNVSPYFDDFNRDNSYYKVLFKPGYPVQARELTTMQSMLQNQIEQFGNHTFKEGSVVIPGQLSYRNDLSYVKLENIFQGIPVEANLPFIPEQKIRGQSSGVTAIVERYVSTNSGVENTTLYVRYLSSGSDNSQETFFDGENIEIVNDLNIIDPADSEFVNFQAGEVIATVKAQDATGPGSGVAIQQGVYFLRGTFVDINEDFLFLEQYSNFPSYKVGFRIFEEIINSYEDPSLNDNAKGFSNYAAPGADRFRIYAQLTKVDLDSTDTDNFVELAEIRDGNLITISNTPEYNILSEEFARRTYDESGDYYVKAPNITAKETLNNLKGNNGVFNEEQVTYNGNIPSEDLGTYEVSPMTAYVQGFEVETLSPVFLDFDKPRETKELENQSINYFTGPTFTLNRVYGSPNIGIATGYTVSLRDERVGAAQTIAPGSEIGLARVYDFALESGSYSASNPNENQWDIALYDIQTYTNIELNEPISLSVPTHVKGRESGAVGFLRYDTSDNRQFTVYNTKGSFSLGEKLIFDGIENTRVSTAVTAKGIGDVKAVHGIVGSGYTFTGDTIQSSRFRIGQVNITANSGGISTVSSTDAIFVGIATVGNLVAFSNPGLTVDTLARIESVSLNSLTISGVTTVTDVADGGLPTSAINPANFRILTTRLQSSTDNTLYTPLPKQNIANVDLTESNLTIKRQYDVTITANSTGAITAGPNLTFLPYDEERYTLIGEDGTTEELSPDKLVFTNGSQTLTFIGLSGGGPAKLIASLRKTTVKEKKKIKSRAQTIVIDKSKYSASGIGATTLNDGLTYGNYAYGTRVQDEEIALLKPDVTKLNGIFESNGTGDPELPSIVVSSLDGPTNKTNDLILGEEFIGSSSDAIGMFAERVNDLKLSFIYQNSNRFVDGEEITFKESGIKGFISLTDDGDNNITSSYTLDAAQRKTIYDQSRVVRKTGVKEPTRKLKIVFESATFDAADTGDITTVNSYEQFHYCNIPEVNGISNADMIDIRPRVSTPDVTENARSPFEFLSRSFIQQGNSAANILASDESFVRKYSFYLPRIDKILLTKDGIFQVNQGVAAENPQEPVGSDDALEVATAILPAYLCNVDDVVLDVTQHKRYRMQDIAKLEDRIKNLEFYTALTLLEVDTQNMLIRDANGLNRFKAGFFVDDYSTTIVQKKVTTVKNSIDIGEGELRPTHHTTSIDLLLGTNALAGIGTAVNPLADGRTDTDLVGSGVRRTGQVVTLDYEEVSAITQPYSTRVVNVTPYAVGFFGGSIALFPSSDVWVDQVRVEAKTIIAEGNYTKTLYQLSEEGFDKQTGLGPVTWGSWETVWTGESKTTSTREVTRNYQVIEETIETTTRTGTKSRTGSRRALKEEFDNNSFGDQVLSSQVIPYVRSRNVEFTAKKMKLFTRVYPFFDGVDVSKYIIPKLLQVTMTQGTFQVGETVHGSFNTPGLIHSTSIKFRVATPNHKYGPYDAPNDIFTTNPYDQSLTIPDAYSSTSTVLNIDTYSLANQPQGDFYGSVEVGITLRGQTSGAEATLDSMALVTDHIGTLIGSYFIPDPNVLTNPKFEAGTKLFRLTSSDTNSQIPGSTTTSAEENYFVEGKINTVQEQIISIRNAKIVTEKPVETENVSKEETPVVIDSKVLRNIPRPAPSYGGGGGSSEKVYQGFATGYIYATGTYGFVNQNAGNYSPWRASQGQPAVISSPAIGQGAIERAVADGYSPSSIRAWMARPGTIVGPWAAAWASDINLKKNITPIDNALNRLMNITL